MKINYNQYKIINSTKVNEWAKKYYSDWLVKMQNQDNKPCSEVEIFFRGYSQGIHTYYNRCLRSDADLNVYFKDSPFGTVKTINKVINEMNKNAVQENIVVFRYVDRKLLEYMLKWGNNKKIKKNIVFWDKGFLSTTLTPHYIFGAHSYATWKNIILEIYVPKGTSCVFLELISDMHENEMLFPPKTKLRVLKGNRFSRRIQCIICEE